MMVIIFSAQHFASLWPTLADVLENFLFTTSRSETPLNADERKRHEYIDTLIVDHIRSEILPNAEQLPKEFMQRIIEILNRGSINSMDPNDVLGKYERARAQGVGRLQLSAAHSHALIMLHALTTHFVALVTIVKG